MWSKVSHSFVVGFTRFFVVVAAMSSAFAYQFDREYLKTVEQGEGQEALARLNAWQDLLDVDRPITGDEEKITRANQFFNQVSWVSDIQQWGSEDYWATPAETLVANAGDCEDYSIGKYFSLIAANVDNVKLRITYVKSITLNQAHMVLAYYPSPSSEPLILDNINGTVLPASQRKDLLPIYSFNGEEVWLAKSRSSKLSKSSQEALPQWAAVNARFASQLVH